MAEVRTPRAIETREKTARYEYKPSSTLPDPDPIPGITFRWIATHILGQSDPTNVSRKRRDGWEPVKAIDHPELMLTGTATGNVEIGGLMLCSIPTERVEAMSRYYAGQNTAQMDAVDNSFMNDSDPRMAKFADRKSATTKGAGFGSGSK